MFLYRNFLYLNGEYIILGKIFLTARNVFFKYELLLTEADLELL